MVSVHAPPRPDVVHQAMSIRLIFDVITDTVRRYFTCSFIRVLLMDVAVTYVAVVIACPSIYEVKLFVLFKIDYQFGYSFEKKDILSRHCYTTKQ